MAVPEAMACYTMLHKGSHSPTGCMAAAGCDQGIACSCGSKSGVQLGTEKHAEKGSMALQQISGNSDCNLGDT